MMARKRNVWEVFWNATCLVQMSGACMNDGQDMSVGRAPLIGQTFNSMAKSRPPIDTTVNDSRRLAHVPGE